MTATAALSAIGALAAVVALILFVGWAARRTGLSRPAGAGAGGRLRVEGSLALDRTRRLILVSCDGQAVLLMTGAQDVVVGWLPPAA